MTATAVDRDFTRYDEGLLAYPVAAATTLYLGTAIAVDATGYAVSLTDSAAVKFVGIASEGVINTVAEGFGVAGDLDVKVHTRGVHSMVSSGLAITDQLADMYWADNQTVQTTPTNCYAGKLARYTSATEALVDIGPALGAPGPGYPLGEYVVPTDIQTAAFGCAVSATWEDEDVITLLNAALTSDISTGRRTKLRGALEIITGDAVAHTALFADGGTTGGIDKVASYTTPPIAGSYFVNVDFVTDASGQIKIQADDQAQVTFIFHLKSFSYMHPTAVA